LRELKLRAEAGLLDVARPLVRILRADLQIEVTSDGQFTRQDGDAPILPWAARPWHVVQDSVYATCEHILQRFRAGQAAEVSGADNFRTYALCEAAYAAAASGRAEKPIAL